MKKIIFIVLVLFGALPASAQFYGGFYVGINGSQVDGDNFVGFNKLGLNIGPTVFVPLSDRFAASLEILYNQKGSASKVIEGFPRQYFLKLDYVDVPVMLNYHDDTKGRDRFTLSAGASIGRLVNSKEVIINSNPYNAATSIRTLRDFDYNVIAGGSYRFAGNWIINARYSYSILQMGSSETSKQRNQGLFNNFVTIRIGYIIQGKAK